MQNVLKWHWRMVDMAYMREFKEQEKAITNAAYGALTGPSNLGSIFNPGGSILETADGENSHV